MWSLRPASDSRLPVQMSQGTAAVHVDEDKLSMGVCQAGGGDP